MLDLSKYNPEIHHLSPKLRDTFKYGYSYVIVYKDALDISIPLDKTNVYNEDGTVFDSLSLNNIHTLLGKAFVPVERMAKDYYLVQVSFDEKLMDGKREQELLKELLEAYKYQNIRDLDNDGINDSEVEDIDWAGALADTSKNYFLFVSARELQEVPIVVVQEPTM